MTEADSDKMWDEIDKKVFSEEISIGEGLLVVRLLSRLETGEHERCPGCFRWVGLPDVGSVLIFQETGNHVPFALCNACCAAASTGEKKIRLLDKNIKSYLSKGKVNE